MTTKYYERKQRMPQCTIPECKKTELSQGLCPGHLYRKRRYGDPLKGREFSAGYTEGTGYRRVTLRGGSREREHRILAERALGKPLPAGAVVHHHYMNRDNTGDGTLVICPNEAYHQLLHRRQRAFEGCGHADWRQCYLCKQWSPPGEIYVNRANSAASHTACGAADKRRRYANRNGRGPAAKSCS